MTEQIVQNAINSICDCQLKIRGFIDYMKQVHGQCCTTTTCKMSIFIQSLGKCFGENNPWDEKKEFFTALCKENENIFMSVYHLKKYGFVVVSRLQTS